jgi:hypothetical protein
VHSDLEKWLIIALDMEGKDPASPDMTSLIEEFDLPTISKLTTTYSYSSNLMAAAAA